MRHWILAAALAASTPAMAQTKYEPIPACGSDCLVTNVEELTIDEMQARMASGKEDSVGLLRGTLWRIEQIDRKGPTLRSIIALSPREDLERAARESDRRRKAGKLLGPLDGIPVLIKDNIETKELPTTAGSLALKDNRTGRDAPVVARLRAAGAVILGKTNLSEWANIRSTGSMSGWSAVGGLVRNPYALDRTACGSSSGSGAAVAASLAAVALGTETDGSVVCPASMNGLVGLKPTIGLVSRTHIVPISHSQDTAGPMGRTVKDVAILFGAMVGTDPADSTTREADSWRTDFAAKLSIDGLKGVRLGVIRPKMPAALAAKFEEALGVLKAQGAVLVEITPPKLEGLGDAEFAVLKTELKADLNAYLATTPAAVKTRTLADVIAFNEANKAAEMPFFGQEIFLEAEKTKGLDDPEYKAAREKSYWMAAADGLAKMMRTGNVSFLVEPTYGMPWLSDPVYGDKFEGPSASELPAVAGWPHLTVPMGLVQGLPVGLSFIGSRYTEPAMLQAGYAYEQAAKARVAPSYAPSAPADLGSRATK
ncbi:MAG: amidase [Sphingomonadales bacterium]|nr:MAG: amidase [Sphingomonadales bacterium]